MENSSQDIIFLKNGDEIQAVVSEIGTDDVKYKKIDNSNGPSYTLKKSEVFMIRYANGSKDVFNEATPVVNHENRVDKAIEEIGISKVLKEALERISHFENLCSQLTKAEGIIYFYEEVVPNLKNKWLNETHLKAQQIFSEVTGGMTYAEINSEIDKRIGRPKFSIMPILTGTQKLFLTDIYGESRQALKSSDKLKKFLDSYKQDLAELNTSIEIKATEMEHSAVMLIPEYYRYSFALEVMLKFAINRRVSTWKECVDLYETQVHRWRMETDSEENLRIQRDIRHLTGQAAKSAKTAAIFSGLNYFLK